MSDLNRAIADTEWRLAHHRAQIGTDYQAVKQRIKRRLTSPVALASVAGAGVAAIYLSRRWREYRERHGHRRRATATPKGSALSRHLGDLAWRFATSFLAGAVAGKSQAKDETSRAQEQMGFAPPYPER